MTSFRDLNLKPVFLSAVEGAGYETPTPIQERAIPPALDGNDLIAIAQTGTGKTAAFALPALQWLDEVTPERARNGRKDPIRVLVLSPTRELASQIDEQFRTFAKGTDLKSTVIFGGVKPGKQIQVIRAGVDILVATPGRLLDLMGQGIIKLDDVGLAILDEADRMLDMGFIHDVKRIMRELPSEEERQTFLFSATMPDGVAKLAQQFLIDPVRVEVTPPATTVDAIAQSLYLVDKANKRKLLVHLLKEHPEVDRALVFSRTKHGANRIAQTLDRAGISAAAIHGNKSQGARERALGGFKKGTVRVLVATDIAARGLDIDGVSHVIQLDLPEVPEQYVHRIGRTARAGKDGIAWAFCGVAERGLLKQIVKTIRRDIDIVEDHPFPSAGLPEGHGDDEPARKPRPRRRGGRSGGGRSGGGRSGGGRSR